MSIADDLNSIRTHLEDDYTALEQLGVSVEDRNIENIKNMANQIYAKFPKTEFQEGSNIILSNTLKGKLDFENDIVGYGQTSQDGTPTPETPIEIEVVRGKNLFDEIMEVGSFNLSGLNTEAINRLRSKNYIPVIEGQTYTFSVGSYNTSLGTIQISVSFYDKNDYTTARTSYINWSSLPFTFTIPSGTKYIRFLLNIGGNTITLNDVSNIQLEQGSQATSYLPYNTLEVVERGKNLLEDDTFVQGSYLDNTSTIRISCRNTKLKANTTYTLSSTLNYSNYNIAVVTSTNQFPLPNNSSVIYDSTWKNANFSFTTGDNDVFINISIKKLPDGYTITPSDVIGVKFQIEEGSTATTYEPYQTPQTYQLSLGDIKPCGIGDYKDYFVTDRSTKKWYFGENIRETVFNGVGYYAKNSSDTSNYLYYSTISNAKSGGLITDKLQFKSIASVNGGNSQSNVGISQNSAGTTVYFNVGYYMSENTLDKFKEFLQSNNISVLYILATPTETEITGILAEQLETWYNAHSNNGTTIITSNGDLPLVLKTRALKG